MEEPIGNKWVKRIIISIAIIATVILALFIFHTFLLYKGIAVERRKVINEIYQLYNSDKTDSMEEALLKTCIGDSKELGSYAKAERSAE